MPKQTRRSSRNETAAPGVAVRPIWSGTITFGLVSIPVDLLSAVRPRQTAMKLVDKSGHALGRQYHCSKEGKKLDNDDLERGYETESGKIIPISDEEFDSVAPEMSGDIELRNFVPLEQIPPLYFQKPYFLAPSGKSAKAYSLLAATMERTGRVGIGSFVMRGHEYLVAIVSDHGVLRADTLRYADEIRDPQSIGLPKPAKVSAAKVNQFVKDIAAATHRDIDLAELEDQEAGALAKLVKEKQEKGEGVIHSSTLESADSELGEGGGKVIDLMAVLRRSLSKKAVVENVGSAAPIDLAAHRERRSKTSAKRKSSGRKSSRKRSQRAG